MEKASEKQQALYDIFVSKGILAARKEKLQSKDPQVIADTMVKIITRIEDAGASRGFKFDIAILFHGSKEILINLLESSGIQLTEEEVVAAVKIMVGKYLNAAVQSGKMTRQQVAELGQQAQQMQSEQPQTQPQEQPQEQPQQPAGIIGGAANG